MGATGDLPAATELFAAANKLRGSVESAEYKHLVLGLVFLKYVSDSFDRRHDELARLSRDDASDYFVDTDQERDELLEDRDEYASVNVFWVPVGARWPALLAQASKPEIGVVLDRALDDIERENEALRGVLPKVYARAALPPEKLGDLVSTIAKIGFGDDPEVARDVLGRVYEYFIKEFARSEAIAAASSTPQPTWCGYSSRCLSRTRGGSSTLHADPAACSSSPHDSSVNILAVPTSSRFTGRRAIKRPGVSV